MCGAATTSAHSPQAQAELLQTEFAFITKDLVAAAQKGDKGATERILDAILAVITTNCSTHEHYSVGYSLSLSLYRFSPHLSIY